MSHGCLKRPEYREKTRLFLIKRDGRNCHWCGERMTWTTRPQELSGYLPKTEMTFEHIIRVRDKGRSTRENLVLACYQCNNERD